MAPARPTRLQSKTSQLLRSCDFARANPRRLAELEAEVAIATNHSAVFVDLVADKVQSDD